MQLHSDASCYQPKSSTHSSISATLRSDVLLCLQKFVMQQGIPVETATRVYRRYLKLEPTHVEEYIAYLKKKVRNRCCHSADTTCCADMFRMQTWEQMRRTFTGWPLHNWL